MIRSGGEGEEVKERWQRDKEEEKTEERKRKRKGKIRRVGEELIKGNRLWWEVWGRNEEKVTER